MLEHLAAFPPKQKILDKTLLSAVYSDFPMDYYSPALTCNWELPEHGILCFILSEPICAVGYGVASLFGSQEKQSRKWRLAQYSLTGVSVLVD